MSVAVPAACFPARIALVGRYVDRGEWASGHALLTCLRQCAARAGCPDGDACGVAVELLMADLRGLVREQTVTDPAKP